MEVYMITKETLEYLEEEEDDKKMKDYKKLKKMVETGKYDKNAIDGVEDETDVLY